MIKCLFCLAFFYLKNLQLHIMTHYYYYLKCELIFIEEMVMTHFSLLMYKVIYYF